MRSIYVQLIKVQFKKYLLHNSHSLVRPNVLKFLY